MKKFTVLLLLVALVLSACKSQEGRGPDYKKRLKLAEQKVDKIMEMMDLPEYGLVKMAKEGLYTSKDFTQAGTDMMKHGREMNGLDYPDEEFLDLTKEMLTAFDGFESALKSKDGSKIKESWEEVALSCKKCHDIYD